MSCPERVAVRCISPMVTLIMLLKPLVWLLTVLANAIMRMMRVPLNNQDQITNEDVIATVEAGAKAGVIAPLEHTAITNMMGLENHLVPSAMTARDSIIYFSLDESDESIREKISLTPHNKFLVVDGDIDHVLGVVDGKQLLKLYADGESLSIRKPGIVQPIITIPDSLTLTETLDLFKKESSDFAVVINEYGLTVGIITLKDILWPVMGNYDVWADDQLLVERADGTWLVDGSTPVDDIEREFGIESMPEEETYETVSGFIMYMLRRVPKRGDFVEVCGLPLRGHQHGRLPHRPGAHASCGPPRQARRQGREGREGPRGRRRPPPTDRSGRHEVTGAVRLIAGRCVRERHAGLNAPPAPTPVPHAPLSFEGAALRIIAPACEVAAPVPRPVRATRSSCPGRAGARPLRPCLPQAFSNAAAVMLLRGRARPFPASEAFVPRRGSSFFGAGFARSGSRRASARAVPPRCGAKASRCGTHSSGISGRWPGPSGARLTSSLAPSPFPRSTAAAVIFWASSSESPPRPFRLKGLRSTCPTNPRATCL
ncbi:MAG: transporter associated domain-containing protein [Sutterella wadsworthensis]